MSLSFLAISIIKTWEKDFDYLTTIGPPQFGIQLNNAQLTLNSKPNKKKNF